MTDHLRIPKYNGRVRFRRINGPIWEYILKVANECGGYLGACMSGVVHGADLSLCGMVEL